MDEKFQRLENKVDKISENVSSMDKNLAIYNEQLKIHIEGTEQNRESIKFLQTKIEAEFKPVNKHINMVEGALKFIGAVAVLVGVVVSILKLRG